MEPANQSSAAPFSVLPTAIVFCMETFSTVWALPIVAHPPPPPMFGLLLKTAG